MMGTAVKGISRWLCPLTGRVFRGSAARPHRAGAWAFELLHYARHRLRCCSEYVLFATWYLAEALLKRVWGYERYFVCRLKVESPV
jgi:hypothetical protein